MAARRRGAKLSLPLLPASRVRQQAVFRSTLRLMACRRAGSPHYNFAVSGNAPRAVYLRATAPNYGDCSRGTRRSV